MLTTSRLKTASLVLNFSKRGFVGTNHLFGARPLTMQKDTQASPVETAIKQKMIDLLNPSSLTITNDSWKHRHHHAMQEVGGGNGETHFSIHVVSDSFKGKTTMHRHRMIYGALSSELKNGLHALSLQTKTPEETDGQ